MTTMKVLLIGAHGRTGRLIARRLHEEAVPFRVTRRIARSTLTSPNVMTGISLAAA